MTKLIPDHEALKLPCPLKHSWQRSQCYGLNRDDEMFPLIAPSFLQDAREQNLWVRQFAAPLLTQISGELSKHPSVMVMSDATGLVLETCGHTGFLHKAERFALSPGHIWSELARGTNAIGTALALQSHCEVSGNEHYLNLNSGLFCSASPVFRPDGQLAGVVDMSTPAVTPRRDAAAMVLRVVRQIEHAWVEKNATRQGRWLLRLHHNACRLGSDQELILLFEDNVLLGANKLAADEFDLMPLHFGQTELETLFPELVRQEGIHLCQALNAQFYYTSQIPPVRRLYGLSMEKMSLATEPDKEKALRIINAGIALCLTGETGSGKEYFSQELYKRSRWHKGKFVAVNCAAIPENLIESELFGYVPGAFSGASPRGFAGKFREASGGVLFLDEVGDMPVSVQTRLLRVLQEKKVTPLGSNTTWDVDFALICATHRDLNMQVKNGEFREDLFYRIREFHHHIPPLRDRSDLDRFILRLWKELGGMKRNIPLSDELVAYLARCPWPGNIRQLISLLKVLMALAPDNSVITLTDLPAGYQGLNPVTVSPSEFRTEKNAISDAGGNMSLAAKRLGVSRSTLYRRLRRDKG